MPGFTPVCAGMGAGCRAAKVGGAALPNTHSGHCASLLGSVLSEPSAWMMTFTMPAEVQITSSGCGLTMGLATATPKVNANQSSANLASQLERRKVCRSDMEPDCSITNR